MAPARGAAAAVVIVLAVAPAAPTRSQPTGPNSAPTFAGAGACAPCHPAKYDRWRSGRHARMFQPAGPASVEGDFGVPQLTLHGRSFQLRAENGRYFIGESYLTGRLQEHRVEYTLGSRRIQHYVTTIADGRMVILPPSWDVLRQRWFDNMEIVRPDENDRQPVQQWNKNCFGCHVSGQENHYDPATRTYATTWLDFGTSCERCHGPGGAHVSAHAKRDALADGRAAALVVPSRLGPDASTMVCAQCHSLRDTIAPGFTAGADYYDYFLPFLEYGPRKAGDPAYWADGRPRRFSNDAVGLWQSQCFLLGGATCTTCHRDPHLPNVDRNAQLDPANNALCTVCHPAIGAALSRHTHHGTANGGSSCVDCHMPKTVISIKATMRDHTIGVPAPENTVAFGIPNACTECHRNRSARWAVDTLNRWWPNGRRTKLVNRARAFTAAREGRPDAVSRLVALLEDDSEGPLVQANAAGYLGNYVDPRATTALIGAATAGHPAIRMAAVSSLGRLDISQSRPTLVAALEDPRLAVRLPAFMALFNRGGGPFSAGEQPAIERVRREFVRRARLSEDDSGTQRDLGLVELLLGNLDRAAAALEISVDLEPDRPSSTFLLALARLGQKRVIEARALLRRVPASDPLYHAARARLKQLGGDH